MSSDAIGILPIRLVAPITEWKPYFESNLWHVKLAPGPDNGLTKLSTVDALQLRGVDIEEFADMKTQRPGYGNPVDNR